MQLAVCLKIKILEYKETNGTEYLTVFHTIFSQLAKTSLYCIEKKNDKTIHLMYVLPTCTKPFFGYQTFLTRLLKSMKMFHIKLRRFTISILF